VAKKDDILYIAGGFIQYPTRYQNYSGPSLYPLRIHNHSPFLQTNDWTTCLDTVLRSLDISKSFRTSLDSAYYIKTERVLGKIPGVSDAAFFPTESGFDLTFGKWEPHNSTNYGKEDPPIEDKKWQYDIATEQWTDTRITRKNWFETNTSRRISSAMTAWVPSLKKGFFFGGTFFSVNGTSLNVTALEAHNGLITYDQATNTWTNETTNFGGIIDGGLVHLTTATDEVLIQLGGTYGRAPPVVCLPNHSVSPRKMLIVSGRENFPRSTSTAQDDRNGIPNICHLGRRFRLLNLHSPLLSNQLLMVPAIKSTL